MAKARKSSMAWADKIGVERQRLAQYARRYPLLNNDFEKRHMEEDMMKALRAIQHASKQYDFEWAMENQQELFQ